MHLDTISNLIITGSNGFVGSAFLEFLQGLPEEVIPQKITLVSKAPNCSQNLEKINKHISYISADLTKPWKFTIPNAHVLNLAADGGSNSYSNTASKIFETISENLTDWAILNKPSRIIHASSGACFGIKPLEDQGIDQQLISEGLIQKKRFIESRLSAEKNLIDLYNLRGTPVTICRLFSFVGPQLLKRKQYAVTSFLESAIRDKQIVVTGNPMTTRSLLSEEDMSAWLWSALNSQIPSDILSIGSSRGVRIGELANFIAAQTDSRVILQDPNTFGDEYVADNLRTREHLNVSESKLWEESTLECIDFLRGIHERG